MSPTKLRNFERFDIKFESIFVKSRWTGQKYKKVGFLAAEIDAI